MAGHSKWANIKRQKARVDAVKGKTFTRLARAIIVAAREGLPDPDANFQLRAAVDKAKAAGIPNENIDRAIAKGAGTYSDNSPLEAIRYEGYGPGGVAILIEALTDNRNRTAADLRVAFSKNGGNLGEMGCVGWMFAQKGVITVRLPATFTEDDLLEACLEAEAESYELGDDEEAEQPFADVFTGVTQVEQTAKFLSHHGYRVENSEIRWIPSTAIAITDPEQAKYLLRLMDALEDLDDVQSVTANFDMADDLMAANL